MRVEKTRPAPIRHTTNPNSSPLLLWRTPIHSGILRAQSGEGVGREELPWCFSPRKRTRGAERPAMIFPSRFRWNLRQPRWGGSKSVGPHPTIQQRKLVLHKPSREERRGPWQFVTKSSSQRIHLSAKILRQADVMRRTLRYA